MIDITTNKPMRATGEPATIRPYLRLPYRQLDEVRRVLDSHGIRYWVDENVLSFNGGPEMIYIDLGRDGDVAAVQAALDSVP